VVSADLRDRAIAVWDALCRMDVSLQNPTAAPQSIEDQLILDTDGRFARAELLEVFAKAALKELERRHNVAKDEFNKLRALEGRHNVAKDELNKLKAAHQSQKDEITIFKKQIEDVRREYLTSTSWRISAPIRIGGRLVRQLRKRP